MDKAIHCAGSFVCCLLLSLIVPQWAAGITLALGVGKEVVYDWYLGKGTPELADLVADVVGVAAAMILGGA